MDLYNIFINNKGRSIHKFPHYFPIYEKFFRPYVGQSILFLEIGAGGGGSSQMWKSYFGPSAKIVTIDIRPECVAFEDEQIKVRIGDQSDAKFLASIVKEFGCPDIILDDGSHQMAHIRASFKYLYQQLTSNGIYMIEDLHTVYWPEYGGGFRQQGSFFEYCKDLIDEMHHLYTRGALPATDFGRTTTGIHFYDSVVVFERGDNTPKSALLIGDPTLYA
jgi:hypothetical protein